MLWEQAFWGALGGVTFSSVMNKAGEFINKRLDKDWTSAENKEKRNSWSYCYFSSISRKT